MKSTSSKNIKPSFKTHIIIFLVVALIILTYSIIELRQSKKELLQLMEVESHSLLESILSSSHVALLSYEVIESEMKSRLLNNANFIKLLFEKKQITNSSLKQIAQLNNIYRVNIYDNSGNKIFSNYLPEHTNLDEKFSPKDILRPIFNNQVDTLILGTKEARYEDGYRFAVAVTTKDRCAIVVNINAEDYLNFRKSIGFGALLKKVTAGKGIEYSVLQDSNGIIAASGKFDNISSLNNDLFLQKSLEHEIFSSRIISNDSSSIFEAVHPFTYKNHKVGLLRIGISAEPLLSINEANNNRVISLGFILLFLGSALLAYIFKKQNFEILKKNYFVIEDYSRKVIENVSDVVLVLDEKMHIITFNKAAENLFKIRQSEVLGSNLEKIMRPSEILISNSNNLISPIKLKINGIEKHLMISTSKFDNSENQKNTIIVIRDTTEQKIIEEQLNRRERLAAMGELASGVAHEIRNPLNTISIITQQLNKDFEPTANAEEFHSLASLVHKEILRINETIKSFLTFSKPSILKQNKFILSDLINKIETQYQPMLSDKNIIFTKNIHWDGEVNWDENQIQQVLMNLIQNSFDAIKEEGRIDLSIKNISNNIDIIVEDSGIGVPTDIQNKIFNLYFTSKSNGTGIGLSVVQKIISEHGGTVDFKSNVGEGTIFKINLPINPLLN